MACKLDLLALLIPTVVSNVHGLLAKFGFACKTLQFARQKLMVTDLQIIVFARKFVDLIIKFNDFLVSLL